MFGFIHMEDVLKQPQFSFLYIVILLRPRKTQDNKK